MSDNDSKKVAVVTGGGRGIGAAIAAAMANDGGFKLLLAARTEKQLAETAERCRSAGAECVHIPTDVTDEKQVAALFAKTIETYGRLDVLVNNAGAGVFKPIVETSLDDWRSTLDSNATSAFLCSREALKLMTPRKTGTILNISSIVGLTGYPNQAAYTASKHAMMGLTKVIAEEGKPHGIRAHAICPGGVATEMVARSRPDLSPDILIQPETVAETALFLLKLPPNASIDTIHLRRFGSQSFII